jgi:predicted CXXCH cytochrome family protein
MECESCHEAHGSEYAYLLPYAERAPLCRKCHPGYQR